jgi:hypothetical protein
MARSSAQHEIEKIEPARHVIRAGPCFGWWPDGPNSPARHRGPCSGQPDTPSSRDIYFQPLLWRRSRFRVRSPSRFLWRRLLVSLLLVSSCGKPPSLQPQAPSLLGSCGGGPPRRQRRGLLLLEHVAVVGPAHHVPRLDVRRVRSQGGLLQAAFVPVHREPPQLRTRGAAEAQTGDHVRGAKRGPSRRRCAVFRLDGHELALARREQRQCYGPGLGQHGPMQARRTLGPCWAYILGRGHDLAWSECNSC